MSTTTSWRPSLTLALVILALLASFGSTTDPGAFIAACETNTVNNAAICYANASIAIQAPLSGRPPVALPQQVVFLGAPSGLTAPPVVDLNSSTSPFFAIPPHGSLTISNLSLSSAALPTGPFPLPATAFLSLLAVSTQPTSHVTLVNVNITTPSCISLALHQIAACTVSPSPNFTVSTTSLVVHSYATSSLSATNVTLTCSRPTSDRPTPPPCLARTVTTSQQLLDALTEQLLPPAASTIGEVPLYLFLPIDTSLAGIPTPYTLPTPDTTADTYCPSALPSRLTQSRIVIAGGRIPTPPPTPSNSIPTRPGSATPMPQQPSTRLPELDLAHMPSIFQTNGPFNRVVLRNLTLTNLPYGPVGKLPYSLITAMLWSVWMTERRALGWTQGSQLALQDCELRVAGEELAMWAEAWDQEQRVSAHDRGTPGRRSGRSSGSSNSSSSPGLAGSGSQVDGGALLGGPLCVLNIDDVVLNNMSWVGSLPVRF